MYVCNLFTQRAPRSSQELVQRCPYIPGSNWNLEMLVFEERGKPKFPEKNSRSREEHQQQTQPTYDAGSGNRTHDSLVGGEHSHHCVIPAPLKKKLSLVERKRLTGSQRLCKLIISFRKTSKLLSWYHAHVNTPWTTCFIIEDWSVTSALWGYSQRNIVMERFVSSPLLLGNSM